MVLYVSLCRDCTFWGEKVLLVKNVVCADDAVFKSYIYCVQFKMLLIVVKFSHPHALFVSIKYEKKKIIIQIGYFSASMHSFLRCTQCDTKGFSSTASEEKMNYDNVRDSSSYGKFHKNIPPY